MQRSLTRLVYRSKSLVAPEDSAALNAIFETSRRNNKRDQITGCLAQPDGHFVQVIEGRADMIDRLMERIIADTRHERVVVLGRWTVPGRLFGGWAMARPDNTPLSAQSFRIIDETGSGAQVVGILMSTIAEPDSLYRMV